MKKSEEIMTRILILDGDHKNTLAIVRHLGSTKKYIIDVVSYSKMSITFFSKYVNQKFIISNPKNEPDKYLTDLLNILEKHSYLVMIPVSYISYQICAAFKDKILEKTSITISKPESINLASNKIQTYQLAEKLEIPYPAIQLINNIEDIGLVETTYPCVIKAPFEAGKNIIEYAKNKDELEERYKKICKKNNFKKEALPFIQKYIKGEGAGFFAFYKNGKCINYFIHKRIREYPVSGGASTCAESYYDESILKNGIKILDYLKWEGVAMVEFKKDSSTGIYNLMEINAKFWGSLDLALVCGVNFPQMLIDDALGQEIVKIKSKIKIRFQWILNGDLFHVFERPWRFFSFIKDLFIAKNDFYFSDIKPNLFQFIYISIHYYKKFFK